jgi:hypothetical protein
MWVPQPALTRKLVKQARHRAGLPKCVKKLLESWEQVERLMPRAPVDVLLGPRTLENFRSIT